MCKVIGIDLGGTKINGGLIDNKGIILKRESIETEGHKGREAVLDKIKIVIERLAKDEMVNGIGIGSPGVIDVEHGSVLSIGGNIEGWAWTNIKKELRKEFKNIPIFVGNDANVAAVCEGWLGKAKELESFIMLTLGTGVGGGIYSKQQGILYGKNYEGGELGHAILYPNGRQCNCGQKGCVEQYISGNAIESIYTELSGKVLRGEKIFEQSVTDKICGDVVELFANNLATYLITIKNIFDPEGVVIGGGVINSKEYWWNKVIAYYNSGCNNSIGMKIVPATYLNDAGMLGAAKIVFDKI